ncbi:MAG: sugar nucleotide-binding protein [bacterium]
MERKIFILGHRGMLGNAVLKYFNTKEDYTITTTDEKWDSAIFKEILKGADVDFIINCIGIIPQKKPDVSDYQKVNIDLPAFLETLGKKIVHPSTDCEFSGRISSDIKYKKTDGRDAVDDYSRSKSEISELIEDNFKNTKMIRTSIIGHEISSHFALLDWFLNSSDSVNGYANHYWNGITTLEWAKLCEQLIDKWDTSPALNQYGTEKIMSKYNVLKIIKNIYNKDIKIFEFEVSETVNKCLESDRELDSIEHQLKELKTFYNK